MKKQHKALTQVALGWLLCLGLALPVSAQQRGGSSQNSGGGSSGGGSAQPQRSSPPPAPSYSPPPAPAPQPQIQRGAPQPAPSYSPPAQVQQAPSAQRGAPQSAPSYSPPAQVQSAPSVQRGNPQPYTPPTPSAQRGNPQGTIGGQSSNNNFNGQLRPNAAGTTTGNTQRGSQYPLSFKPNNPGATSRLYPNGSRGNNTNNGFNFRRGTNTTYRSYPGLRFGRNYVSPRPRGFFFNNRGYYQTYYMPQLGFNINTLPAGYYPFYYGTDQYYYSDGLYYTQDDNNYTVVEPPIGATINKLPAKAQSIVINGVQYYEHNGVYYLPVTRDDGSVVYQIAGKDGELNTVDDQGIDPEDLPQVGDMVDHLPAGFKILRLNNQRFYVSQEGYYFQDAVDINGDPVFKIVGTPYDTIEN